MRAAHETLERDDGGRHRFLGYGMGFGNVRIFHSGDTIPFDGQDEEIKAFAPDLALAAGQWTIGGIENVGLRRQPDACRSDRAL